MLKLKNIKKNNGIISAEYEPENSGELGSVSVEVENGKIIESKASKLDNPLPIYLNHAVNALKEMMNKEELPQEKLVMWY